MKLIFPPFFYVKAFWQSVSFILAGVAGLLTVFGLLDPKYALDAGVFLTFFLGILKFFDVEPQVRLFLEARALALKNKKIKK